MKKHLLLFSLFIVALSSCQKSDVTTDQATIDDAKIQAYIKANNITVTKDPSGFYYKILIPGTPKPETTTPNPVATSTVKVSLTNSFLNGVPFEHVGNVSYKLSDATATIKALQLALPKISNGGRIYFITPSALAYGNIKQNSVPANSILIYTVDLIGFN